MMMTFVPLVVGGVLINKLEVLGFHHLPASAVMIIMGAAFGGIALVTKVRTAQTDKDIYRGTERHIDSHGDARVTNTHMQNTHTGRGGER